MFAKANITVGQRLDNSTGLEQPAHAFGFMNPVLEEARE